jgi:hypothetical protein
VLTLIPLPPPSSVLANDDDDDESGEKRLLLLCSMKGVGEIEETEEESTEWKKEKGSSWAGADADVVDIMTDSEGSDDDESQPTDTDRLVDPDADDTEDAEPFRRLLALVADDDD